MCSNEEISGTLHITGRIEAKNQKMFGYYMMQNVKILWKCSIMRLMNMEEIMGRKYFYFFLYMYHF